jgi:hypothetical protein
MIFPKGGHLADPKGALFFCRLCFCPWASAVKPGNAERLWQAPAGTANGLSEILFRFGQFLLD